MAEYYHKTRKKPPSMHLNFYPPAIHDLIATLRQLPGIGQRSAERLAFSMLDWPVDQTLNFCQSIQQCKSRIHTCVMCGCLYDGAQTCWSCKGPHQNVLCVVAFAKEAFAIHSTGTFKGSFHVLGGLLDPMQGIEPENLKISSLVQRGLQPNVQEVLLALDATLEGDATSLYIRQVFEQQVCPKRPDVKISRLAFGMPMNSSLEYVDAATLSRAVSAKNYW